MTTPFLTQDALLYKIVRRLWRQEHINFSRNRNYEAYDDATVQRAMRIARHLKSVEQDILKVIHTPLATLNVTQDEEGMVHFMMDFQQQGRRHSILNDTEWRMLLEHEQIAQFVSSLKDINLPLPVDHVEAS